MTRRLPEEDDEHDQVIDVGRREGPDGLADHSRIHAVSSHALDIGADTAGLESGHSIGDSASASIRPSDTRPRLIHADQYVAATVHSRLLRPRFCWLPVDVATPTRLAG